MIDKICEWCKFFIKGTEEDPDKLSAIRDDTKDTDQCIKTHYKVNKDKFCIMDENKDFEEKT